MKLIKPSFEIREQPSGLEGVYKQIEGAGRVCYKSEDKIAEGTAKAFVDRMIASGHGAMLEHGTVYLKCETEVINRYIHPEDGEEEDFNKLEKYEYNSYSVTNDDGIYLYVTTNLRVLVENDWLDDLQYICEPTVYHEKRITVKFICDRGVSHEFVRHRVFSFAQESTRYCNYSKDKFDSECTFIIPCWLNIVEGSYTLEDVEEKYDRCLITDSGKGITNEAAEYIRSLIYSEKTYFSLLDRNWRPQQARAVLPNSLKTELVMTGFVSDWKHFFELRCSSSAHPQARELAIPLQEEFITRGYINN
jgi:thymidylate synthase (FAD)